MPVAEPVRTAAQVWEPLHPRAAPQLLAGLACRWWIAGGWALDLFMGTESRPHRDLDVGSQRPRPEDDADFRAVAPRLDDGGRSFLHDALGRIDPRHPWLEVLAAARGMECA